VAVTVIVQSNQAELALRMHALKDRAVLVRVFDMDE